MARAIDHVIHDIVEAIERVDLLTRGRTLDDFKTDWQLRWLVERAIEIISEASRAIPDDLRRTRPEIPWPSRVLSAMSCATNTRACHRRSYAGS